MKINVKQVYTSVACNRLPEIVDWNSDGLICFGASNSVVIYDTNQQGGDPLKVFHHHKSIVNSVKWLVKPDGSCTELLSCSADKTAAIWTLSNEVWSVTSCLAGHSDGVACVCGLYADNKTLLVYTASIDSTIKVWERIDGNTTLKQTISLNSGLCLTFHAHLLPIVNKPVLLCALDDHKIHIFAEDKEAQYHRVHMLVGHEDWVRGLDVLNVDDTTIMVASASQDTYIRLWRIHPPTEEAPTTEIKVEEKVFTAHQHDWAVKLEAVLAGHEGWVYGVQWHPYLVDEETKTKQPVYRLLSSSLDKTLIVWEPECGGARGGSGAWTERVRAGEVGGYGLGFYGSRFGPRGEAILGHGYNGSFHVWEICKRSNEWTPRVVCGGHFGAVEDVRWEPRGNALLSVSADQTTRLHAPWRRDGFKEEWHEIGRPQIHGYDLSALAVVGGGTFASAAEEKVVRVFDAPANFLRNFRNIVGEELLDERTAGIVEGAAVPSLGLSNKAVLGGDGEQDDDGYFVPLHLTEPPTEEALIQNTLWPESYKLYGHGYEVYCLDASADGELLASACRATTAEHAAVILWETKTWHHIQKLVSHSLTVTQLAFSPDSQRLVSVSRDRRWTVYQRLPGSLTFEVAATTDKTNGVHTRIVWCCAWAPDSEVFGTGSRDGKVCLWTKTAEIKDTSLREYGLVGSLALPGASVTALAFAPFAGPARILAIGLETGHIRVQSYYGNHWTLLHEMSTSAAHHLTVRRLSFRPRREDAPTALLASCGSDHFVRIHAITLT